MNKKLGYFTVNDGFQCIEMHTFTCNHCNGIKIVKPKERPEDVGGHCSICWALICPACVERGNCDPFEKKLKRAEDRARTMRQYGI